MTNAQRQAFIDHCESGERLNRRQQVYRVIADNLYTTLDELQVALPNVRPSTIAGRVSELLDMGLIRELWDQNTKHRTQSMFTIVIDPNEQEERSHLRTLQRYLKWKKLGETAGFFERLTKEHWN